VAGCACEIAGSLDEHGRVVQLTTLQQIVYGELDGSVSSRLQALNAFMQGAGFDAQLSTNIEQEMWDKWVLLASVGAINCLMRGSIGEVLAAEGGADFAGALHEEVVSIVTALGHRPTDAFLASAKATLLVSGSLQTSSMFRNLQDGQPVEADQILGDLVRRADEVDIRAPLLKAAYTHLRVYEDQRVVRSQF
jgi:2-dehydropantoate 2-reductase